MANIPAAAPGAFDVGSTWVGGVVPGSGDVAFANTFSVTVSDTRTVQAISNASGTGITAGGTFSALNGCNLTCTNANGIVQGATGTSCLTTASLGTGQTATINFSETTTANNAPACTHSGVGTLAVITSGLTGTACLGNGAAVLEHSGNGTLVITCSGNITGTPNGSSSAIRISSASGVATINVAGIVQGGTGGPTAFGVRLTGACSVTITAGLFLGAGGPAFNNENAGASQITGVCQASASYAAIGPGVAAQLTRLSGPFLLALAGTVQANNALAWRWTQGRAPSFMEVPNWNNSAKDNLRTGDNMPTGGYPTAGNVLSTAPAYGDNSQYQGTYIPAATSAVAAGVTFGPAGALTGTAVLTAADVQSALTSQGLTATRAGYLDRLPNTASVDQVASIVQEATSA